MRPKATRGSDHALRCSSWQAVYSFRQTDRRQRELSVGDPTGAQSDVDGGLTLRSPQVHSYRNVRRCRKMAISPSLDGKLDCMKKIGFLSFGHWTPSRQSGTHSAADALLQSIDLAVEAERLGMDGAYFRVHHFAQQLASPFPLLAAVGAKTRKIEIGTAVTDMRYENPHYMVEDAGAADLISGGRLQLGISRGSPEQVIDGWRYFGYSPIEGEDDAALGRSACPDHRFRSYRAVHRGIWLHSLGDAQHRCGNSGSR